MNEDRPLLTVGQAATLVGVHGDTVRRWADSGYLPCFRTPGGQRRFRRSDVDRIMLQEEGAA